MGRLPSTWADRTIMDRIPYEIPGELIITSGQLGLQFPDNTFSNNTDKPFEIHRMKPWIWALDNSNVLLTSQPDQSLLSGLIRANINDLGLNQIITKSPTLVELMVKGTSERTWEWADPHYLTRGNQIQVTCDALTFPAIGSLVSLRFGLSFQGFLLVVAPPGENR